MARVGRDHNVSSDATCLLQQGHPRAQGLCPAGSGMSPGKETPLWAICSSARSLHSKLFFLRREMGFTQANAFPPVLGFISKEPPCPSGKLPDLTVCAPGEDLPRSGSAFEGIIPAL